MPGGCVSGSLPKLGRQLTDCGAGGCALCVGVSCTHPGSKPLPVVKLVDSFDASWDYVANDGQAFTLKTNLEAPRYRYNCLPGTSWVCVPWGPPIASHTPDVLAAPLSPTRQEVLQVHGPAAPQHTRQRL